MKLKTALILLFVGTTSLAAPFEFAGYVSVANKRLLRLTDLADGSSSGWLEIGQSFRGYTLVTFDEKKDVLTLKNDSEILLLSLKEAKIASAEENSKKSVRKKRPPEYAGTSYAMRRGDTLFRIASESGITMDELKELNPEVNWARLRVGQEIRLPPEE